MLRDRAPGSHLVSAVVVGLLLIASAATAIPLIDPRRATASGDALRAMPTQPSEGPTVASSLVSDLPATPSGHRVDVGSTGPTATAEECNPRGLVHGLGCEDWTYRYATPDRDDGLILQAGPDGEAVYVTGSADGSKADPSDGGPSLLTIAIDPATGKERWASVLDTVENPRGRALSMDVSPDGERVAVTGWTADPSPPAGSIVTVLYDAKTGERLWVQTEKSGGWDLGRAVEFTPDGTGVIMAGLEEGSDDLWSIWTARYDAKTGDRLWATEYSSSGDRNEFVCHGCLLVHPSNGLAFAFTKGSVEGGPWATRVLALDAATGEIAWVTQTAQSTGVWANQIRLSPNGDQLVATGIRNHSFSETSVLDPDTGELLWSTTYRDRAHSPDNRARTWSYGAAYGPAAEAVYLAGGKTHIGTVVDATVFALDAQTGERLWAAEWAGYVRGRTEVFGIEVAPSGDVVYATGHVVTHATHSDYLTWALDSETGETLWRARWHGPAGFDSAFWNQAMDLTPAGDRLFVTGWSAGSHGSDPLSKLDPDFDVGVVSYDLTEMNGVLDEP